MDRKQLTTLFVLLLIVASITLNFKTITTSQYAAVFFSQGKTVQEIILKYFNNIGGGKVKVLLVPGHEPDFGGAEYSGLKERDMNVVMAERIFDILKQNKNIEVVVARDGSNWNNDIENYFSSHMLEIKKWRDSQEIDMLTLVNGGKIILKNNVTHNIAPTTQALRLYGISKWANDNGVDITIHIHFNDNPKTNNQPKYKGFSIYVPERQYSNSASSVELANDLMKGLETVSKISTLPLESNGIIEDQDLIAIGRFNTSDSLVALIEYEYIYDSKLSTEKSRADFFNIMAVATSKSITNFFESRK